MWRPPERIKYATLPGQWPDAAEVAKSRLFSPVRVGALTLAHRTWVPAMVPWRASEDGFVTPDVLDWYERFARGRPGAIVVEATGIREVPSGPLLRIGHDRFLPGLRDLVRVVREASDGQTKLFIQIIDFLAIRRRPDPARYFAQFLAITDRHRDAYGQTVARDAARIGDNLATPDTDIRGWLGSLPRETLTQVLHLRELEALDAGYRERVTDIHLPAIRDLPSHLPKLFSEAAGRAREAGFDGVELHYAHAYTMASFLSRLNSREDGYGGSSANRARLPLEVYSSVRAEVGSDFAVGCRFLADECIADGSTVDDAIFFGCEFARAGMDFLSLSRGGKFDDAKQPKVGEAAYPYTGRSGYECMPSYYSDAQGPFGRNLEPTARIRAAIRALGLHTPVVAAGGIHDFAQAEAVLAAGTADIVGFARQALADPDWFRKVASGHGREVRTCLYTNYCEALDQRHRQVTCELWDREALDAPGVKRSSDGKRRLVAPDWA
ncbi:MAG TPA: NADH:flavin oxidoreductase, partial [Steroidobacteraceae bacterium]|nr:NADH:flavin oxidoreductase [Steroidobacteraceae bacterium]